MKYWEQSSICLHKGGPSQCQHAGLSPSECPLYCHCWYLSSHCGHHPRAAHHQLVATISFFQQITPVSREKVKHTWLWTPGPLRSRAILLLFPGRYRFHRPQDTHIHFCQSIRSVFSSVATSFNCNFWGHYTHQVHTREKQPGCRCTVTNQHQHCTQPWPWSGGRLHCTGRSSTRWRTDGHVPSCTCHSRTSNLTLQRPRSFVTSQSGS